MDIPRVSALTNPPHPVVGPSKRLFTPSYDSSFNPAKKRRLTNGVQALHGNFIPSSEERELMQLERDKQEAERQKLLNKAYYRRTSFSKETSSTSSKNSYVPQVLSPHSDNRVKSTTLTLEEKVLREIASRPKFRAKPIPRSHHVAGLVIKSSDRPLTIPVEFSLSKPSDCQSSQSASQGFSQGFKALPLNRQIFEQPDFVPSYQHRATVPLDVKLRTQEGKRCCSVDNTAGIPEFKAKPMPVFPPAFIRKSLQPLTVPELPHLLTEERGFHKQQAFEEQKKSFEEQQPTGFISRPMPIFASPEPKTTQFTPTKFAPFNLTPRSTLEAFSPLQSPQFTAKPMPDFSNPFTPQKSGTQTIEEPFELHSEKRAVLRSVFDEQLHEKTRREEELRQAEAVKAMQLHEIEIQNYRKQLQFTATPMPQYNFFEAKHSEKPLTEPRSPLLETKLRASISQTGQIEMISETMDNSMDLDLDMMDLVE